MFERPGSERPGFAEAISNVRPYHAVNALVAFLFAATGPVALVYAVGFKGGLSAEDLSSWIFVGFAGGGVITLIMCFIYKQPLAHAWTISGTAIVGVALAKYGYSEIVGAYIVTGGIMVLLGVTGGFKFLMRVTPIPIVMAMVAGVFLRFGVLAIDAFDKAMWIALAATGAFVIFSLFSRIGRVLPPILMALIAAGATAWYTDQFNLSHPITEFLAQPKYFHPVFTEASLLDLVLPLLVSVLALQNAQGIAVLKMAKHEPPTNTITFTCGVGSVGFGLLGAVNTCLTGPVNAILASSGPTRFHYLGGYFWALFAIAFGLLAPVVTQLAQSVPEALIFIIGGLAMLRVLQQAFTTAFRGKFTLGAVVTFSVTVTELIPEVNVSLLGIGAPFWGLVFGFLTSLLLERGDFRTGANKSTEAVDAGDMSEDDAPPNAMVHPKEPHLPTAGTLLADGAVTVVSPSPSPFTYRVLITLKEKGIPYRLIEDMTWNPGEGVSENPLSRNPLLKVGGDVTLYDTRTILDYLELARPEPRLMPNTPREAIDVKRWEALAEGVSSIVVELYIEGARPFPFESEEWVKRQHTRILDGLATAAAQLGEHSFCVVNRFTRADIALISMLDHLEQQLPTLDWRRAYPNLGRYIGRLRDRPSVEAVVGDV